METPKQRSARTSAEQLETYISFLEENPQFLASKNTPENPNYLNEMWDGLMTKLNSMKGPEKTAKEWKQSLSHWKNQLKSRARKLKEEQLVTGGGEPSLSGLSSFEQRALNIFGIICVQGDSVVPVLGFSNATTANNSISEITHNLISSNVRENVGEITDPIATHNLISSNVRENVDEITYPIASGSSRTTSNKQARKRVYNSTFSSAVEKCVNKITKVAEDRLEHDKKIAEERVAIDSQTANAMTRMAEAMYVLAQICKDKK